MDSDVLLLAASWSSDDMVADLGRLAQVFEAEGFSVQLGKKEAHGRGVSWYEVVAIYAGGKFLDEVAGEAASALLRVMMGKIRLWMEDRRVRHHRPQWVTIYDADGVAHRALVMSIDGEAIEYERNPEKAREEGSDSDLAEVPGQPGYEVRHPKKKRRH